jgi:hypothetical protein
MVLSSSSVSASLELMCGCGLLKNDGKTSVLIGSKFRDDASELHLVEQINQVKLAMANGHTLVLVDHDNIYEALYDVLNQRYVVSKDDRTGQRRRRLRLAIGTRSQLCRVEEGFRLVVVVNAAHALDHMDLPLLNRFEKQTLDAADLLGRRQTLLKKRLDQWLEAVAFTCSMPLHQVPSCVCASFVGARKQPYPASLQRLACQVLCCWSFASMPTLVLRYTQFRDDFVIHGQVL